MQWTMDFGGVSRRFGGRVPGFDATSSEALADRVHHLKRTGRIGRLPDFLAEAGVVFSGARSPKSVRERFSRWLNNPVEEMDLLGAENYATLVRHIVKNWPPLAAHIGVPLDELLWNPTYHVWAALLCCRTRTLARSIVAESMVGVYAIYRPSVIKPLGQGYVGVAVVSHSEETGESQVRELYQSEDGEIWEATWPLFPMTHDLFYMAGVDEASQTMETRSITRVDKRNNGSVKQMSGFLASEDDREPYWTKIVYERVDDIATVELKFGVLNTIMPIRIVKMLEIDPDTAWDSIFVVKGG